VAVCPVTEAVTNWTHA